MPDVSTTQLRGHGAPEVLAAYFDALAKTLRVFSYNGTVLVSSEGHLVPADPTLLEALGLLRFVSQDRDGREVAARGHDKSGARDLLAAALGAPEYTARLPSLRNCVQGPLAFRQGSRATNRLLPMPPGFNAGEYTFVLGAAPPAARPVFPVHLPRLFSGLLFADRFDHGRLLGWLVAGAARAGVAQFPLLMLGGVKSSGKSTVARALSIILTGEVAPALVFTGDQLEQQRALSGREGRPGPTLLLYDNIASVHEHRVRSNLLAQATNSHVLSPRVHYKGAAPIFDPLVVLTMNGAVLDQDLADRTVTVSLRLPDGRGHRALSPAPDDYAREHLGEIRAEIVDILSQIEWEEPNRPHHTRFYDFEEIAKQGADLAGVPASFNPTLTECADWLLREIVELLESQEGRRRAFTDIYSSRFVEQGLELQRFFDRTPHLGKNKPRALAAACRRYHGNVICINQRRVRIAVDDTHIGMEFLE